MAGQGIGGIRRAAYLTVTKHKETCVQSPCINVCVIEPKSRLCSGCLRSIDEITTWTRFSDQERAQIMAELPERAPRLAAERGA